MAKSDEELLVVKEDTFVFRGIKVNYAVLKNNSVLITYTSILNLLNVTVNEFTDIKPIGFWNSKNKFNNGLYLIEIPKILANLITESKSETLKNKASELLQELSYIALKSLTGEKEIIENEPKKEPSFDQLLGALMKVPPPKKEK